MRTKRSLLLVACLVGSAVGCTGKKATSAAVGDPGPEDPVWHFEPIDHHQGDMTLTDVWGRSDGAIFVVGWFGTIFTNRVTVANPDGLWTKMDSGTIEHLTAIWGVENGGRFHQHNVDGEMFAVGWNGTLLHYHPNPTMKQNPVPEDGAWQVIAGPGLELTPKTKIDGMCPDFDGDGVPDDGDADGWWSPDKTCRGYTGTNAAPAQCDDNCCDDNCRMTANGPDRPIQDVSGPNGVPDGCPNPADGDHPYPATGATSRNQIDMDGDGIGRDCDADDTVVNLRPPFRPTLFDVWATANADQLIVVAVGDNGALVAYAGPDAATAVVAPALPLTDRNAWMAQEALTYRYDNDCDPATPAGTSCAGAVRLPPSCPAQCHPYRDPCVCPVDQGQCCDAGADLTGAGCADGSCGPVANACGVPGPGACSLACPGCFRRMDRTLRSVTSNGSSIVAVGAAGAVVKLAITAGTPGTLDATWTRPDCIPMPWPLDGRPVLTAVAQNNGVFQMVGASGTVSTVDPTAGYAAGACASFAPLTADDAVPPAFLTSIFPLNGNHAYAVGDTGIFLELNGHGQCTPRPPGPVAVITTDLPQNINALWVTRVQGVERVWFVGATGALVRAGCY